MDILPQGIYRLEYSEKQRIFHYEQNLKKDCKGWVNLKIMSLDECLAFCEFMDKKYVDNRTSGILPELCIVKLELDLFFELKKYRRKLAGRT